MLLSVKKQVVFVFGVRPMRKIRGPGVLCVGQLNGSFTGRIPRLQEISQGAVHGAPVIQSKTVPDILELAVGDDNALLEIYLFLLVRSVTAVGHIRKEAYRVARVGVEQDLELSARLAAG